MLSTVLAVLLLFPQLIDSTRNVTKAIPSATEVSSEKRGDIFVARKMYREAAESYQLALTETPGDARLHNKLGISYHRMEMLGVAKRHYIRASALDRKYSEATNNLGTIYLAERRYKRAQRTFEQALKITPDAASVYSNLGTALFSRRKYQQATNAYMKALQLDPKIFEPGSRGGTSLQNRSVEERAKYYYHLAQAFAESGQFDRAVIYLRRSIEEGYGRGRRADEDPVFRPLYELPEFLALVNAETAAVRQPSP
jgi:tetratricopeptide (TPR) repeat protein